MKKTNKTLNVLTIGGATKDIYLQYSGADAMKIIGCQGEKNYMLFEAGAKIEVEKLLTFTGGGATNSAASFKRLGCDVACCCVVGDDDAGALVLADLAKEKVDTRYVAVHKGQATAVSFVINSLQMERTIFAYRGANVSLNMKDIPVDAIAAAQQIYITSLSNEAAKVLTQVGKIAHEHNVPVAINPGISQLSTGAAALKESLQYIDVLILNQSEAKTFMGALVASDTKYKEAFQVAHKPSGCVPSRSSTDEAYLLNTPLLHENVYFSVPNFFKAVMAMGPRVVVVTDGSHGVYAATQKQIFFHPSLHVSVTNTLGAGDAFGSCFVASLAQGADIPTALRNGIVNSASVVQQMGAKPGLLTAEQLEEQASKIKTDQVQVYEL